MVIQLCQVKFATSFTLVVGKGCGLKDWLWEVENLKKILSRITQNGIHSEWINFSQNPYTLKMSKMDIF